MSLLELFRFLVPYFVAVLDADLEAALALAAAYRPACLTTTQQDEAQIFYAAWLLYQRELQTTAAGSGATPWGVKSEKEGDVARTYGAVDGQDDPFGWWSKFHALYALCGGGAITVGHRYGSSCCQH